MTDYAELRAALDAGPTPGPWRVQATGDAFIVESHTHTESCSVDSQGRPCRWSEHTEATAKLIAACHPAIIRALLTDHDRWRRHARYEAEVAQAAIERVKELEAERDALREALTYYVHCFEQHNITNTHGARDFDFTGQIAGMARAALAQGES